MEKIFTISEIAEICNVTAETLRHYDRIGLLRPYKIDQWTNYRYYSSQEIIRLNTICALRLMDLSLNKIKEILELNDFEKVVEFLKQAEKSADNKINNIKKAYSKIQRARAYYESKLDGGVNEETFIKTFPQRIILLSDNMREPSLDNLWNYHSHFYNQLGEGVREEFLFEDLAGIYQRENESFLFASCVKHVEDSNLIALPEGNYLCADCTEDSREDVLCNLLETAKSQYGVIPEFSLQIIVLSGILQWNYQIQIYIKN